MIKAIAIALSVLCTSAFGQSLYEDMTAKVEGYIFVNPNAMTHTQLIYLAQQARRTGASLVLRGYISEGANGLRDTQNLYSQINEACCGKNGPPWKIHPHLYQTFGVKAVPTFVVTQGNSGNPATYAKTAGMFGFDHALEMFVASKNPAVREASARALKQLNQ